MQKLLDSAKIHDWDVTSEAFQHSLRTGRPLCTLMNVIETNSVSYVNEGSSPFAGLENLTAFVSGKEILTKRKYSNLLTIIEF